MFSTVVESKEDRLVLSITPEMQQTLHLAQGDHVEIDILRPQTRRRFSPGQLVREHAEILPELVEDRAWIDAPAVGREII